MSRKRFKIPMKGDSLVQKEVIEDKCDVCGKGLGHHWVILGSKQTIHLGGRYGDSCYRKANGIEEDKWEEEEAIQ